MDVVTREIIQSRWLDLYGWILCSLYLSKTLVTIEGVLCSFTCKRGEVTYV